MANINLVLRSRHKNELQKTPQKTQNLNFAINIKGRKVIVIASANIMETTDTANLGDDTRPTKRIRCPPRTYYEYQLANELTTEEERMLAQAIAKSRTDQRREPLTVIPFGPTFYPTIEDFSGDPLDYLETIRHEAEKYGEFVVRNSNARFVF